jgi:hypothetical protein
MLHLHNINPMVRAVGTMGAVSALVGGITFAQLTSNTVALSANTLSTGSANLEIGTVHTTGHHYYSGYNGNTMNTSGTNSGTNTNQANTGTDNRDNNNGGSGSSGSCSNTTNGTVPGFNLTGSNGLLPGVASDPLDFCLKNASNIPLDLTVAIPSSAFTGDTGIQPSDVTLNITCGTGHTSDTLAAYANDTALSLGTLSANGSTNCEATVELSSSYDGTGTQSVPSFDIQFMGTGAEGANNS